MVSGYYVAPFLLKPENIDAFQDALLRKFKLLASKGTETKATVPQILRKNRTVSTASANVNASIPPWEGLKVSSRVNEALEEFAILIIDNYINKWYEAEINSDNAFVGEIQ